VRGSEHTSDYRAAVSATMGSEHFLYAFLSVNTRIYLDFTTGVRALPKNKKNQGRF